MQKFIVDKENRTVTCLSSFAGVPVRGIAKCDPEDEFDETYGAEIAKARCDLKIAQKRQKRSAKKYYEALVAAQAANERLRRMKAYMKDAEEEYSSMLRFVKRLVK